MRLVSSTLLALVVAATAPPAAVRTFDFAAARRLVGVHDAQISPDGTRLAYVRTVSNFATDRGDSRLMLVNLRTRATRALVFDRRGLSSPQWSPSGNEIAFTADAKTGDDVESQLFVLPLDGGEAKQITALAHGVQTFAWSPDGKTFAIVTPDDNPQKKQIDAHLDAFEVTDNDYLHTAATPPFHLWLVAASGGKPHRVTRGDWSLGTADPDAGNDISWSAESGRVAFERFPNALIGDSLGTTIHVVDVRSGVVTKVTRNAGLEGSPRFAPVGNAIAYLRPTAGFVPNGNALYLARSGGEVNVGRDIGRNVGDYAWTTDAAALWVQTLDGTHSVLWYQPVRGSPRRVALGNLEVSGLGSVARTGAIAFTASTPQRPSDIYVLGLPTASPVRVTHENAFLDGYALGRSIGIDWVGSNGFREDGVLTYPPNFTAGKKYPLVLLIHGGPQSASTLGWSSRRRLFAAHGYLVFEPNYRGSTNLGDRYQAGIYNDAGVGPGKDVMAGVAAVRHLGIVDDARIGVTGWSYGGYMTSWLIGHYHIWKAAMSGAALNDWLYDYNISFYVHTDEPYFKGSPWDPRFAKGWREQSPIAYAGQIKTPTLIMGDIGDNNVTITNSFEMYHALKDNGVPVQFVAYPVNGHFPSDPIRSEDVTRRWLGWLDKYLGGRQL